jgi:hypothetical protein
VACAATGAGEHCVCGIVVNVSLESMRSRLEDRFCIGDFTRYDWLDCKAGEAGKAVIFSTHLASFGLLLQRLGDLDDCGLKFLSSPPHPNSCHRRYLNADSLVAYAIWLLRLPLNVKVFCI